MLYCAVKLTSDKGLVDNSNIKFPNCLVLHQKSLINPFNFSNTVLISGALRTGIHKNKSKKKIKSMTIMNLTPGKKQLGVIVLSRYLINLQNGLLLQCKQLR